MKKKAVFNWSGGKDSALALYKILQQDEYEVIALLTTIDERTSMHLIPEQLLDTQAECISIPLHKVFLPSKGLEGYESAMRKAVEYFKSLGVNDFIFGDIFLHDVKKYREAQLSPYGINVIEPLWKSSEEVIVDFLESGIKTRIIVTQADKLDESFVGKDIDKSLIESLPAGVDPCGENGEYHTFAYGGPLFKKEVPFATKQSEILTYDVKLDDGQIQTFSYWHTPIQSID